MRQLYASLFYQNKVVDIFSDRALISYLIDVEVALAEAQAELNIIPISASNTIQHVGLTALDKISFDDLTVAIGLAGNVVIPFVKQFTALVKEVDEEASRYVHWGATSQDILDTACILQCRDALEIIKSILLKCYQTSLFQADQYRSQVMMGRTWLQQALPITLGHKFARWASAFKRNLDRIEEIEKRVFVAQLGGAVGSLAYLGKDGTVVVQTFAQKLQLSPPVCTWHGERDRIVEIGSILALITGNLGKMARDWSLLMQTEISEVLEPSAQGRGGSSTMPHKRNPVAAASVLAAANLVPALMSSLYQSMIHEHERGLGGWHAEWLSLPEIFKLTACALEQTFAVLKDMEIDVEHMHLNLERTNGLVMAEAVMMALAPSLGRLNAHHIVEKACQQAVAEGIHLKTIISQMDAVKAHFSDHQINEIFDPTSYLGNIQDQIDAVLQEAKEE